MFWHKFWKYPHPTWPKTQDKKFKYLQNEKSFWEEINSVAILLMSSKLATLGLLKGGGGACVDDVIDFVLDEDDSDGSWMVKVQ